MISVAAAIIIQDGCVLCARKKAGLPLAGFWEFPGGKLEKGETPEECLVRELLEEFSVRCQVGSFVAESVHDYGDKTIQLLGYYVTHIGGSFTLTDHDEIIWLPVSELRSLKWAPADLPLVEALFRKHLPV